MSEAGTEPVRAFTNSGLDLRAEVPFDEFSLGVLGWLRAAPSIHLVLQLELQTGFAAAPPFLSPGSTVPQVHQRELGGPLPCRSLVLRGQLSAPWPGELGALAAS